MRTRSMDDRVLRRNATTWPAECLIAGNVVMGTVRDVTSKGAFFQPEMSVSGRFYGTREGGQLASSDESVTLRLLHRMTPDVEVEGRVCWTGVSDLHGCGGLGLEFTQPPVMLKNHAA